MFDVLFKQTIPIKPSINDTFTPFDIYQALLIQPLLQWIDLAP